MPRNFRLTKWITQEWNMLSALLHMITISQISMSFVQLHWFVISDDVCTPYLTLGQFFWFGYSSADVQNPEYECINATIVNMMRIIILLCFMAIIFSLGGFFLDILKPKSKFYRFIHRYALASTCTVFWIMAIISVCYYVTVLLEESLEDLYPKVDTAVTYGYGFYLIASTGGVALICTFCSLIFTQTTPDSYRDDDRCLLSRYDENIEAFDSPTPPPPYSIPPPPYTP